MWRRGDDVDMSATGRDMCTVLGFWVGCRDISRAEHIRNQTFVWHHQQRCHYYMATVNAAVHQLFVDDRRRV